MSANHNGSIESAFKIIAEAKKCGADAVKLQTYRPDTLTLDVDSEDFQISSGLWAGKSLYQLYEWAHTPWDWHKALFDYAREMKISIFSSPFDETAVDLLESLGAPAYKIASFEAVDLALIKCVARTGKPIIISTGLASAGEIDEAIAAARSVGCKQLAILHCVSGYPAPASDYNLRTITDMYQRFGIVTGLSDHTISNITALASVSLGSSIIEKHFTLNRFGGGADDSFSMEPEDLAALCRDSRTAWEAMGVISYERKSSEIENIKFRRSLYFVKDLNAGDVITRDSIRSVRPGYGLPPKFLNSVIGMRVLKPVFLGDRVQLKDLDGNLVCE